MPEQTQFQNRIAETLARVDERTKNIQNEIQNIKDDLSSSEEKVLSYMNERLANIRADHEKLSHSVKEDYVKKETFAPVQKIVYGLVGMILSSVGLAVLAMVVIKP